MKLIVKVIIFLLCFSLWAQTEGVIMEKYKNCVNKEVGNSVEFLSGSDNFNLFDEINVLERKLLMEKNLRNIKKRGYLKWLRNLKNDSREYNKLEILNKKLHNKGFDINQCFQIIFFHCPGVSVRGLEDSELNKTLLYKSVQVVGDYNLGEITVSEMIFSYIKAIKCKDFKRPEVRQPIIVMALMLLENE